MTDIDGLPWDEEWRAPARPTLDHSVDHPSAPDNRVIVKTDNELVNVAAPDRDGMSRTFNYETPGREARFSVPPMTLPIDPHWSIRQAVIKVPTRIAMPTARVRPVQVVAPAPRIHRPDPQPWDLDYMVG